MHVLICRTDSLFLSTISRSRGRAAPRQPSSDRRWVSIFSLSRDPWNDGQLSRARNSWLAGEPWRKRLSLIFYYWRSQLRIAWLTHFRKCNEMSECCNPARVASGLGSKPRGVQMKGLVRVDGGSSFLKIKKNRHVCGTAKLIFKDAQLMKNKIFLH